MASGAGTSTSLPLARLLSATADAVHAVMGGRSLNDVLAAIEPASRPGVQALSFRALRWWGSARTLRERLAPKPPPPAVDALLCTALALLWPVAGLPYPAHTLVDQAVDAARRRAPASASFINAVLRRFLREQDTLVAAVTATPVGAYNHPPWWIDQLRRDWPDGWPSILEQANRHPPMTLRVNARRSSGVAYVERLRQSDIAASVLEDPSLGGQAVVLGAPRPVQQLPGFAEGEVSVQDAAAQRAARLLLGLGRDARAVPPGARVLDACAAPGGKTAQLLEQADVDVLALDVDAARLERVRETLGRLGLQAGARVGDARDPRGWWDGRPFDAILVDAPCSASGIVRRHPDVRWLRRAADLRTLSRTQDQILDALWPLLVPGGRLVYATCSLFRCEGQERIDAFLQRRGPREAVLDAASPGHLLPLAHNGAAHEDAALHDGFFLALLHKPAAQVP